MASVMILQAPPCPSSTIKLLWLCPYHEKFSARFNASNHLGALSYALQEIETSTDPSSDLYGHNFM